MDDWRGYARERIAELRSLPRLTPTEEMLLWTFQAAGGRVVSHEDIARIALGYEELGEGWEDVVRYHVTTLRKKLGARGYELVTYRGEGWRLRVAVQQPGVVDAMRGVA